MSAHQIPDTTELEELPAQFAPTSLKVDISHLSGGDRNALSKLIEAARIMDRIFLQQVWSGNEKVFHRLEQDPSDQGKARQHLFRISKGPWSTLDDRRAFLPGVPERKPAGANFYPEDMTHEQFERWVAALPQAEADEARGFFSVIRCDLMTGDLKAVPYHLEYQSHLERAATLLREAAALTSSNSLERFLQARATAFLNSDYFESDLAWMDLDGPLDITIGPYETYTDELFGYKAAFEAYICVTDERQTQTLKTFATHLQEVENNLPIAPRYRNPKLGSSTPIRVVNEIFSSGDGNHGVQTAAYNLPNDDRIVQQKGTKNILIKNVQEAKFATTLMPIAKILLPPSSQADISFDWFFTHILAHELSHGIGPHKIDKNGCQSSVRLELKELYSTLEEAKADITGLFMLQYFFDKGILPGGETNERRLYNTFLASSFRTLRFGIHEAHGRGMAVQFKYLIDHGAFVARPDGRFEVNIDKIKLAVRSLTRHLLTIEAEGNYIAAQQTLGELGVMRPELIQALGKLQSIPVDIEPIFVTAHELSPDPC